MEKKRILLKISGESLAGEKSFGIEPPVVEEVARNIARISQMGAEIGLVVGGGNIFRGVSRTAQGMDRATADYMGMLATIMNALALHDALGKQQAVARVMSAIRVDGVAEPFIRMRAHRHLEKGRVVIFAGGTGNPYFTTDTAACVRAIDIGATLLIKATRVDGVYDKDPEKHRDATLFERLSFDEVIVRKLAVMDSTAVIMCRDHGIPIRVINLTKPGALERVYRGEAEGTIVE